jgi:hypothetical protein
LFLDTLLGSGTVVVAIILSFLPLIESLRSQGVRVPERLIGNLAGIGKIFLAFAVYTSVVLFLEYYLTSEPVAQLYPFLDVVSMAIFLYMIYRIVQLFSTLTTKRTT